MAKQNKAPLPLSVVEDERGPEVIAKAIEETAAAAQRLLDGGLSRRGLIVLLHDSIPTDSWGKKPSKADIGSVLDAASGLRKFVTRKP